MSDRSDNTTHTFGAWFRAALMAFAIVGVADWALSVTSATGVNGTGYVIGFAKIVGLWILGATLWTGATGLVARLALGAASLTPITDAAANGIRRYWNERHSDRDPRRLATALSALVAFALFAASSVFTTTHLIENREVAHLIAAVSFVLQLVLATAALVAALILRRGLTALLSALRKDRRLRWLNTPLFVGAVALTGTFAAATLAYVNAELFIALEGITFALATSAIILHLAVAHTLERRLAIPPLMRHALWTAPLIATIAVGTTSQQPDARRLVVLHGEASQFAFHHLHRHVNLDRLFDRSDCPPLGRDGNPVDGTPRAEFEERCLDPAFDRPFAREDIPEYDRPHFDENPAFILVTWDSVRVDRLGFRGHYRDTTPNLDAFAAENLVFDRAFAQDSGTGPSFWSMMAGKTPFQVKLEHGNRFPPPISEEETMLGVLLEEAGYTNKAIMCGTVFEREYWGIRWGFERFDNVCGREVRLVAPTVTEEAIDALRKLADSDEPFFLWVHYWDPHIPYTHHPDIGYGDDRLGRYDEELTYTDRYFGELLEFIYEVEESLDRPLFTIFSADHGENFDEHGSDPHARNLYRIVTQVPKIVRGPGVKPRNVDPPVALSDLFPTVLDLADIPIPDDTTMVSQVPVYYGAEPDEERMVFQENSYSRPRRHTRAVIYGRYQYIMDLTTNSDEFYDYVDDPIQQTNLIGTGLVEERIMRQALIRFLETSTIPEGLED